MGITTMSDKYGFIDCPEVKAAYGCDVFCPAFAGLAAGETVDFDLIVNDKGKPQASNVRVSDGSASASGIAVGGGGFGAKRSAPATLTGESHVGTIKTMSGAYGFIECAETMLNMARRVLSDEGYGRYVGGTVHHVRCDGE